jgi:myo-inositol-1-phosphate synthase
MCERRARQLEGRELDICIKGMHAHMRGTKLKEEEEEEEELQKREEALKKKKNLRYVNESSRKETRSLACISIAFSNSVMDGALYVFL